MFSEKYFSADNVRGDMENKLYWSKRNYIFKSEKYGWLLYSGLSNSFFSLSENIKNKIDGYLKGDCDLSKDVKDVFFKAGILSN